MTKSELIGSASGIHVPSTEAAAEFRSKRELISSKVSQMLAGRPDLERLIGPGNQAMMEDNHRNHGRFMESLFHRFSGETLVETVLWVFRAYRAHGFHLSYWPAQLDAWVAVLQKELSEPAFQEIYPLYHWMIIQQPAFVSLSEARETSPSSQGNGIPGHP